MRKPLIFHMASGDQDGPVYQYLLVELQGARTNILGLWSSVVALTILFVAAFSTELAVLSLVAIIIASIAGFFLWRYLNYLDAVKSTVKAHALGLIPPGSLRERVRTDVLPKEVRITSYDPHTEDYGPRGS